MTDPNTTTPATLRADALDLLREIAARKRYDPNVPAPWGNNSGWNTIILKSELLARVDALLDATAAAPAVEPIRLVHVALAEDGGNLRWMTGRKPRDCELYMMPDGGRAPAVVYATRSAPVAEAEPIDKLEPALILTGAQLLEALDLVAPDRTADQFESEVSFQYGNGHSGKGMYCWITDYPDEGASLLDGSTVAAQAVAADGDALKEAVTRTIDTIRRQLELIFERAPGNFLDKVPVVQSLTAHKHRLEKALAITVPRAAVSPATAETSTGMPDEVRESLMDSQYLAGVKAGWNAANAADPNAALEKIHASRAGYLRPLRDWQKAGRPGVPATPATADERAALLQWATERWDAEVKHRPLINVHRRSLDDTWRQVIRHCGGDDVSLLGPRHDALLAANPINTTERDPAFIDNDLDFEPDAQHAVADMANIGYALMQTIERMVPGYCWNESPTEIVSDLLNERDEARASQDPRTGRYARRSGVHP